MTGIGAGSVSSGGDRVDKGVRNTAAISGDLERETFLVDVPEEVLVLLSEMLAREEGQRSSSMKVSVGTRGVVLLLSTERTWQNLKCTTSDLVVVSPSTFAMFALLKVVAARLSRALGLELKAGKAVVPGPTMETPSAASLCDETPAEVEAEDNHSKVRDRVNKLFGSKT